ncbi:myosin phosphatase Rho-interacting protein-like isoform X1 [Sparus aurata]|uniref:myosin phosphatase Rho-interacting protein-like isoform X1 n=1 Tax=Sparus aurata TaxID=8175 RepID=UPI0011C174F4|nr:myosin phosphatase Rho-interacting protein-like isoform X1 [Sparus aurata]
MSTAKENPCRKFQANFFNKSKCQNCFKPRELHLLTDQDLTQAKPIYGGWLCLAPEGTDFDNPMQRSRKWQRRFFVLYEHGCLRFALDESNKVRGAMTTSAIFWQQTAGCYLKRSLRAQLFSPQAEGKMLSHLKQHSSSNALIW